MTRTLAAIAGVILATSLAAGGGLAGAGIARAQAPPPAEAPPNSLGGGWRLQQNEVRQGVRQRKLLPLGEVIEQIRRRTPGRQLDAGLEYRGDRPVYRVRWITRDGRRIDYLIDAATGAIVGKN